MGNPTQNRPLLVDSFDVEYSEMLETLFRTLTPYFDEINSLTDNRLTFDQNSLCAIRELPSVTLNKVNSGGVIITTDIENPVDVMITLEKEDGTLVAAADIEWKSLGSGRIQITKLNTLQTTGSVNLDISDVFANQRAIAKNTGDILALAKLINTIKSELSTDEEAQLLNTNYRLAAKPKTDHITITTDENITDMASDISANTSNVTTNTGNISTNTTRVNTIRTRYVEDLETTTNGTFTFKLVTNGTLGILNTYTPPSPNWDGNSFVNGQITAQPPVVTSVAKSGSDILVTTNTKGVITTNTIEDIEPDTFLKSISTTNAGVNITITDQDDADTEFEVLPNPTLANAGKVVQISADGSSWILVSAAAAAGAARELPAYAFANGEYFTRTLFAVNNVLAMNRFDQDTKSYVSANLTATDAIVPCKTIGDDGITYTDNNIPLE